MTIASGVAKRLAYKKESAWGVAPGTGSAQYLRRVKANLELAKADYTSQEINSSYQIQDDRHGYRSVKGAIDGELSAGTWKDFLASAVRKAFVATAAISGATITVAGAGPTYTLTRSAGSYITDGIKVGDIVQLTAGVFNAANLNKNLLAVAESALVLTVLPLNGVALVAEGPIAAATLSVPGKRAWVPATGQTDESYAIESWYSDISQSELFLGCKISDLAIQLPPSGMAGISINFLGKDVTTAAAQYYVTPTVETTTKLMAAVNGALLVQGSQVGLLTGLNFTLKANMSAEPIVGQNVYAGVIPGRIEVAGQFSVLFQDATFRDYFLNETEIALVAAFASAPAAAADVLGFSLPRIKVGGATRDDGEKGLVLTCPFVALRNSAGGAGQTSEDTTLLIQDSQA